MFIKYINKMSNDIHYYLNIFSYRLFLRRSEIYNLQWQDVKINQRFKYGEITVVGKGNKRRNIRMNKTVYNMLIH